MEKLSREEGLKWLESDEGKAEIEKALLESAEMVSRLREERKKLGKNLKDLVINI